MCAGCVCIWGGVMCVCRVCVVCVFVERGLLLMRTHVCMCDGVMSALQTVCV